MVRRALVKATAASAWRPVLPIAFETRADRRLQMLPHRSTHIAHEIILVLLEDIALADGAVEGFEPTTHRLMRTA